MIEPLGYSLVVPDHSGRGLKSATEMGMSQEEHVAHLGLNQTKKEKLAEVAQMRTKVLSAIPIAMFATFVMGWDILAEYSIAPAMSYTLKEFFHHLLPILATFYLWLAHHICLVSIGCKNASALKILKKC